MGSYLVSGCAGFIGSHLAETLLARGDSVVGIDSFTDYYARDVKEANLENAHRDDRFTFAEADLSEVALDELTSSVDGIFHLAAQPGVRGSWGDSFGYYARDNVVATQRVFEMAARARVRVVFASSSSVYGDAETYPTNEDVDPLPISPYGVTKLTCEHLARTYAKEFDLDVVALRYFTVYGPRQRPDMAFARIVRCLADGVKFTLYGTGEQSRDFTFVEDAVSGTIGAMERGRRGAIYNVGGGTEASLLQVIQICERLSGRRLRLRYEPRPHGDVTRTAADTGRVRADLGWSPATPLKAGLRRQLADAGLVGRAGW